MNYWARKLRRLLCRHTGGVAFVRNIYGDEINSWGGKRSLWACKRCGRLLASARLNPPSTDVQIQPQGAQK